MLHTYVDTYILVLYLFQKQVILYSLQLVLIALFMWKVSFRENTVLLIGKVPSPVQPKECDNLKKTPYYPTYAYVYYLPSGHLREVNKGNFKLLAVTVVMVT